MKPTHLLFVGCLVLAACDSKTTTPPDSQTSVQPPSVSLSLDQVLDAQPEAVKARYAYRHPKETLEFFGIKPGMTVVEVLPGDGWYSQILVPYLGSHGRLIGLDYDLDMWSNFDWVTDEFINNRNRWPDEWTAKAADWAGDAGGATAFAYPLSAIPDSFNGQVDAVLFIRALHNLYRYEISGAHLTRALDKALMLLKPGGVVGIVQHQASDDKSDEWADGSRGYLKKSLLIEHLQDAGFELVAESDINTNPLDQPGEEDSVWRLPPGLHTSRDNPEQQEAYKKIGESNRMTLLFRKPE